MSKFPYYYFLKEGGTRNQLLQAKKLLYLLLSPHWKGTENGTELKQNPTKKCPLHNDGRDLGLGHKIQAKGQLPIESTCHV